jgi:8-amino-7-oxononanoate synthase
MSLERRWSESLHELRSQGRYRSLQIPQGIDLTSNDYLGYAGGRAVGSARCATQEESLASSTSGTASRLLRGHHPIWDEVESMLADWHGAHAALMMAGGYAANEGLLSTIVERDDWVASDEHNHASIVDGLKLNRPRRFIFRHNDLNHLEAGLREEARSKPKGERFIVTESLFSMEGDRAPLSEQVALAEKYGAHLIVDEAHANGCFGSRGAGLVDEAGLRSRVLATVHTGGKALGVAGAYICGNKLLKEYLVNHCRHLIFSTALPPAMGEWWRLRIPQVQADDAGRDALQQRVTLFRRELGRLQISAPGTDQIVPIILGSDDRAGQVASRLQATGNDIRAIRSPTVPVGEARLRISIHADHAPEMLQQLAADLQAAMQS